MLKVLFNFAKDEHFYLACSGGVDSMAAADFFKRGGKNFTVAYFNHATPMADKMESFVRDWCMSNNVKFVTEKLTAIKDKKQSKEEFWRIQRYNWLQSLNGKVVTCHHLNDVAETWIFSSLNGNPKILAEKRDYIYRPFILNTKQQLIDWCVSKNINWIEDESNKDVNYPRNRIRHNIMPEALKVNPGLLKVLKKKILQKVSDENA